MKNAHAVLSKFGKDSIFVDEKPNLFHPNFTFVAQILSATNKDAKLNQQQETFLQSIILYHFNTKNISFPDAMKIATWINTCH